MINQKYNEAILKIILIKCVGKRLSTVQLEILIVHVRKELQVHVSTCTFES
jgi:hypothetical protein